MATKLLLVEDSLSIQTIVEATFVREDFEILVSGDALDGLHKAQTLLPDIVLADASMPGMDGFQLCQRLRQSASGRQVPVVLLTSGFAVYDKVKGDRAGVTTHLAKPFDPQVLLALVKQLVPVVRQPVHPSAAVATLLPHTDIAPFEAADSQARQSEATPSPDTTAGSLPQEPLPWGSEAVPAEATQTMQQVAPRAGSEPLALNDLYHALGVHLIQMLHETLKAHLTTALAQLMPQMLDTVRDVVRAQMPDLLEVLLQREIDTLKQAAKQDQREA